MTPRAAYHYTTHGSVICIVDEGMGKSVTNDVENVLEDLRREGINLARFRVIYRDSQGLWDEIVVADDRFRRFRAIGARTLEAALDQIRRLKRDKLCLCTKCGERERPKPKTRAQLLEIVSEAHSLLEHAQLATDPPIGFDTRAGYQAHCREYAQAILHELIEFEITGLCEDCAARAVPAELVARAADRCETCSAPLAAYAGPGNARGVLCPHCNASALADASDDSR